MTIIDGLWCAHITVGEKSQHRVGGVLIFSAGHIVGGDSANIYTGRFKCSHNSVTAHIFVKQVSPGTPNVLGHARSSKLRFRGVFQDARIIGIFKESKAAGGMVAYVRLERKASLLAAPEPRWSGDWVERLCRQREAQSKLDGLYTLEVAISNMRSSGVLAIICGWALGGDSHFTFAGSVRTTMSQEVQTRLQIVNFIPTAAANLVGICGNCEIDLLGSARGTEIAGTLKLVHRPDITGQFRLILRAVLLNGKPQPV
jgi:hypothetical protein